MSAEQPSHSPFKKGQSETTAAEPRTRPVGRNKDSKIFCRILSACDTCRQMKSRCTRENPCLMCERSQKACNYSPCNRLGRPKGSKNRRKPIQRPLNMNKKQKSRSQGEDNGGIMQWIQREQQQSQLQPQLLQPELNMIELEANMMYTVDPTMALGDGNKFTGDISGGLMLGMTSGLLDSLIANDGTGQNHDICFSQTSRWLSKHPLSLNDPGRIFPPNGAVVLDGGTFPYNNSAPSCHT